MASKIKLSEKQRQIFNKRLPFINQIGKSIAKTCALNTLKKKSNNEEVTEEDIQDLLHCANQGWSKFKEENSKILDDETFNVIQLLRYQIL